MNEKLRTTKNPKKESDFLDDLKIIEVKDSDDEEYF